MERQKINYKSVLDLGFERYNMGDGVFFDRHGYDDFYMFLKVGKKFEFAWQPETSFVELRKMSGSDILGKLQISTLEQLKTLVGFMTSTECVEFELPSIEESIDYSQFA